MMETITVEGRGCVHVVPDVTRLDIKVKGLFKNYKEAYERAQQNSSHESGEACEKNEQQLFITLIKRKEQC